MKPSSKQYAKALFKEIEGGQKKDIAGAINNFVRFLHRNGDLGMAENIIADLSSVWDRTEGVAEAEVTTARKMDGDTAKLVADFAGRISGAKKVVLKTKIEPEIIGGVIFRYRDKLVDASLRTKLDKLKKHIAN